MITTTQNGRMYLPPKDETKPNDRVAMHPETNTDQVLVGTDGTNLTDFLGPQVVLSAEKPSKSCLWFRITGTRSAG